MVKNLLTSAGAIRDTGLIPGMGRSSGGGHDIPLEYPCLENHVDRGAWRATVHAVAKSRIRLKWLSTHTCNEIYKSSFYWTLDVMRGSPGRLSSKEPTCQCRRCRFNPWVGKIPWRKKWQPTPVFLPGKSHGQRSLAGYSPRGRKESDTTEHTHVQKWRGGYLESVLFWRKAISPWESWKSSQIWSRVILESLSGYAVGIALSF